MDAEECFYEVGVAVVAPLWGAGGEGPGPDGFVPGACEEGCGGSIGGCRGGEGEGC